jgi:membrane-associated phospholipid phosphatase
VRERDNHSGAVAARLAVGLLAFVGVAWAAGELWLSLAGSSEVDFMRTLARERSAAPIDVARVVTWAGSTWVLIPLALVCAALLIRAGRRLDALAVALGLGGAIAIDNAVKALVARQRPTVEHLQHVSGWSYPSGHSGQAAAFWTSLLLVVLARTRTRPGSGVAIGLTAVIVLAVACSRVYLGVHYPSDVIAGALLGCSWALFTRRALSWDSSAQKSRKSSPPSRGAPVPQVGKPPSTRRAKP